MRLARDHELTDNQTGKVDDAYMAVVEVHTARRVSEYAAAKRRLAAAEKRHKAAGIRAARESATARERRANDELVRRSWLLVEERLRELRVLERMMTEVPASRDHRGSGQAKHRS